MTQERRRMTHEEALIALCAVGVVLSYQEAIEGYLELRGLSKMEEGKGEARPLDEWHEDIGNALWWTFPITEPPYSGTPLDTEWPGYHTHWTPIPLPSPPRRKTT